MPREASGARSPRVVVASGMSGTGVTMITDMVRSSAPSLEIVDGGSRWGDIRDVCEPEFARMLIVTTHDIVAVSSAYALIKLVRERYPEARIEVLVNRSDEREALKTYGRVQAAASHFLGEMVGYAGSVPDTVHVWDEEKGEEDESGSRSGAAGGGGSEQAIMALQDLAIRLSDELVPTTAGRGAGRHGERRMAS